MTIDTTFFGYGAGLVMAGWILGQVFALAVSVLKPLRG